MGIYYLIKRCYRATIPSSLGRTFFDGRTPYSRLVLRVKAALERGAAHDELYDQEYFRRQAVTMAEPGRQIAESLHLRFAPKSVLDVGCGSGCILLGLRELGVACSGLEYADAALAMCQENGLSVSKFDLESDAELPRPPADILISTEVAEHLPESIADKYVLLCASKGNRRIIITAAPPGQGGTDHVNEQPNSYWIEKFEATGCRYDAQETEWLRADWKARGVEPSRARNVLVFFGRAAGAESDAPCPT